MLRHGCMAVSLKSTEVVRVNWCRLTRTLRKATVVSETMQKNSIGVLNDYSEKGKVSSYSRVSKVAPIQAPMYRPYSSGVGAVKREKSGISTEPRLV